MMRRRRRWRTTTRKDNDKEFRCHDDDDYEEEAYDNNNSLLVVGIGVELIVERRGRSRDIIIIRIGPIGHYIIHRTQHTILIATS